MANGPTGFSQRVDVPSGMVETTRLRRGERSSCRPFGCAQARLQPASRFRFRFWHERAWIPACAGM